MKEDIIYKVREIKYHRMVYQIRKDITERLYSYSIETLEEFFNKKYPGIKIESNYVNGIFQINVTIPRPVHYITCDIEITPNGINYGKR